MTAPTAWIVLHGDEIMNMSGDSSVTSQIGKTTARFFDARTAFAVGCVLAATGALPSGWKVVRERDAPARIERPGPDPRSPPRP